MSTAPTTTPVWHVSGDYCETCSCLYICSCSTSNFTLPPNRGDCKFALVFHIDRGAFGAIPLDDLTVALVGYAPAGI